MDLLENIVFPQSPTNILLLKYLLFLTLIILLPYLSVMISTTLFSVMHFNKGNKTGNKDHLIFSNNLIDMFTVNKGMSFSLGLVPILSIMFIFGQLLLNSTLNVNSHLLFAFILLIAALIYTYTFKYSFRLKNIFNLVNVSDAKDEVLIEEFQGLQKSNSKLLAKSGYIAFILLIIVAYIIIAVLQVSVNSNRWVTDSSFTSVVLSVDAFLYFLFYLSFSFSITSAAILFKLYKSGQKKHSNNYLELARSFTIKTGLIFTFIQPLLFVISSISSPVSSLSFSYFVVITIVLLLMLLVSIIFYVMYSESKTHLGGSLVFVFLILASVLIYKDQLAFDTASERHMFELEKEYISFSKQVKEAAGINEIEVISGEDIYNAKCIACHQFDTRLVGPPYNEVLPKYDGKMGELVNFILNPSKVNPDYTAMPNQGLKPKEAEAIAEYIVTVYNSK